MNYCNLCCRFLLKSWLLCSIDGKEKFSSPSKHFNNMHVFHHGIGNISFSLISWKIFLGTQRRFLSEYKICIGCSSEMLVLHWSEPLIRSICACIVILIRSSTTQGLLVTILPNARKGSRGLATFVTTTFVVKDRGHIFLLSPAECYNCRRSTKRSGTNVFHFQSVYC